MTKLTDAQRAMLLAAAAREDGAATMPAKGKPGRGIEGRREYHRPKADARGEGETGRAGVAHG